MVLDEFKLEIFKSIRRKELIQIMWTHNHKKCFVLVQINEQIQKGAVLTALIKGIIIITDTARFGILDNMVTQ